MPVTLSSVLENLDIVAVLSSGFFAGTSLHISMSELPALRKLDLSQRWKFFPYLYQRTALPQAGSAGIAGIAGIIHGLRITNAPFDRNLWLISGSLILGIIPYTFAVLMSTNKIIIGDSKAIEEGSSSQIDDDRKEELLDKWALGHLVRTFASVAAFGAMTFAITRHGSLRFK